MFIIIILHYKIKNILMINFVMITTFFDVEYVFKNHNVLFMNKRIYIIKN